MSLYTHPVLRDDTNDIKGKCDIEIDFDEKGILSVKPIIKNKDIVNLIESNQASVELDLINKSSFFRKLLNCNINGSHIELDQNNDPSGKYNVYVYVRASKDILNYKLNSFHSDYDDAEFVLSKGGIIAYLGNFSFIYQKDFQKEQEKDSIFELDVEPDYPKGAFKVAYLGNSIIIQMNTDDHNNYYKTLDAIDKNVLLTTYIMPALIDAIMEYDDEEHEGRDWALTISDIIEEKNLDDSDPVFTAQRILADPVNSITKSLIRLAENEENEH